MLTVVRKEIKSNKHRVSRSLRGSKENVVVWNPKNIRNFKKDVVTNNLKFYRDRKEGEIRERNHCNHLLFTFESQL